MPEREVVSGGGGVWNTGWVLLELWWVGAY